jgi:hypothetical protein
MTDDRRRDRTDSVGEHWDLACVTLPGCVQAAMQDSGDAPAPFSLGICWPRTFKSSALARFWLTTATGGIEAVTLGLGASGAAGQVTLRWQAVWWMWLWSLAWRIH